MRDGHNGYGPSPGIAPAREAVAAELTRPAASRSRPIACSSPPARRKASSSRCSAARRRATAKCSCRCRPIRSTRRCSRSSARARGTTGPIRRADGCRISITSRAWSRRRHACARRHRSEQPDRRDLSRRRRAARCSISPSATAWRSWPTRSTAISDTTARSTPLGKLDPDAADHLVLEPVEGVSRAGLADRLDGASAASPRLDDVWRRSGSWPTAGCAARCRCSTRSPQR